MRWSNQYFGAFPVCRNLCDLVGRVSDQWPIQQTFLEMIRFELHKQLTASDGQLQLAIEQTIEKGQFVGLYGVSGAGKTSTLRMLAGLMKPDRGRIEVNGTGLARH
jgi:ABC-type transport system involved in cytochrome bd biosynthesis fused ATPase/permease subunit